MASSREYLEFVLEQLSDLDEVTYRAMMGEFIIYYRGKVAGGIYDRLLVKPAKAAISYMPTASYELPYDGGREMLLVGEVDNPEFLTACFVRCMTNCHPQNRKRRNKHPRSCCTDAFLFYDHAVISWGIALTLRFSYHGGCSGSCRRRRRGRWWPAGRAQRRSFRRCRGRHTSRGRT